MNTTHIDVALCLLPLITASWAIAKVFSTALKAISKNPESYGKIISATVLGTAFIESIVLIATAVAFTTKNA